MGITFSEKRQVYSVNTKGKQITFSKSKYGPLAIQLAEQTLLEGKRIYNIFVKVDTKISILKIYSKLTDKVYDILVDNEDIEYIKKIKWYVVFPKNSRTLYVSSDKYGKLHRYIIKPEDDELIDHIDRNGLNNTKSNLRCVCNSLNKKNMSVRSDNKIGYNGISLDGNAYRVSWQENGKQRSKKFNKNKYANALVEAIAFRKQKEKEFNYM